MIFEAEEKIGGLSVYPHEYEDCSFYINSSDQFDINFKDSPFTWWNGRVGETCIFKRLDKIVTNQVFLDFFNGVK